MSDEAEDKKPAPRLLGGKPREKTIVLEWPIEYDGVVYREITIRRLTGAQVREFMEAIQRGEVVPMPPMISVPLEVYEAMDDDDRYRADAAALDFLPLRLRVETEATTAASTPDSATSSSLS